VLLLYVQLVSGLAMEYRRDLDGQTWHFCRNCSQWPRDSYNIIRADTVPTHLELCNQCIALKQQDDCERTS